MIRKIFLLFVCCLTVVVWVVGYKLLCADGLTAPSGLEPPKSQLNRVYDVKSHKYSESTESYNRLLKEIEHLNKEVAILKKKMGLLRGNNETQVIAANSANQITQNEIPKLSEQEYTETIEYETEILAEQQDQHRRYIEDIDARFEAEVIDDEWSTGITGEIQQTLEQKELNGTFIVGIQCKSTLCRVEVEHENVGDASEFSLWFPNFVAENLANITIDQNNSDDGYSNTVVYLARADYE